MNFKLDLPLPALSTAPSSLTRSHLPLSKLPPRPCCAPFGKLCIDAPRRRANKIDLPCTAEQPQALVNQGKTLWLLLPTESPQQEGIQVELFVLWSWVQNLSVVQPWRECFLVPKEAGKKKSKYCQPFNHILKYSVFAQRQMQIWQMQHWNKFSEALKWPGERTLMSPWDKKHLPTSIYLEKFCYNSVLTDDEGVSFTMMTNNLLKAIPPPPKRGKMLLQIIWWGVG